MVISGKIINLRMFEKSDVNDTYVSWLNDIEVVKYSNQRFIHHTIDSCYKYLDSFLDTDNIFMAVEDKATMTLCGSVTAYIQTNHGTADIGLLIGNKDFWGKGVGFEAWTLMMGFLFNQCDIRKVTGGTLDVNIGMVRIMQKSMMIHEATREDQELLDNKPVNVVYFCKFSDEK